MVQHVGQIIRRLRTKRGWTQQQLASKAHLPLMTVSNVENNKTNWTRDVLTRIAKDGLGLDLAQLFVLLREARIRRKLRPLLKDEASLLALWARVTDPAARQEFRTLMEGTARHAAAPEADGPPGAAAMGDSPDGRPARPASTPDKRRL